ncbi:hypothetical protein ACFOSS_00540 [Pseudaeromonas sharmana]|uniref:Uncharacterized protein n=1 Tax=Pseudaeromonas sharmana TaxID=328412 RepID=A0ABV8CIN3_9GAMM
MLKKIVMLASLLLCSFSAFSADDSAATRPLFLRGEMNNWEAPKEAQLIESEAGVLVAKVTLQASHGAYKFKFADEKWKGDTTYGQFDPSAKVTLDTPVVVKAGYQWSDMKFTPDADGSYTFTLDRRDANKITVTVKKG